MRNTSGRDSGGTKLQNHHPRRFIADQVQFTLLNDQQLLLTCRDCRCASSLQNLLRFATFTSSFLFLEVLTILLEVPCLPPMETSGPAPRLRSHPRLMPVQRTSIRPLPRFVSPSMIKSFRSVQDSLSFRRASSFSKLDFTFTRDKCFPSSQTLPNVMMSISQLSGRDPCRVMLIFRVSQFFEVLRLDLRHSCSLT